MVPVFTIALESHGEFNENTDVFYTKHAMASKKGAIKKGALYDFESILVSALVSKRKRPET